jgi:hypothetical protein
MGGYLAVVDAPSGFLCRAPPIHWLAENPLSI